MRFPIRRKPEDRAARQLGWRGRDGPHDERVANAQPLERLPGDAAVEGLEIERDVRELGHC